MSVENLPLYTKFIFVLDQKSRKEISHTQKKTKNKKWIGRICYLAEKEYNKCSKWSSTVKSKTLKVKIVKKAKLFIYQ